MPDMPEVLFLPGWGASGGVYRDGLPAGWTLLSPPDFGKSGGHLDYYLAWLLGDLEARQRPVVLAGHSMGAALAVRAAVRAPGSVERLVLVGPAGLRLTKPIAISAAQFVMQVMDGRLPRADAFLSVRDVVLAPVSALRLALEVRSLDLTHEMTTIRQRGMPVTVIGCTTDTLVTPRHCRSVARLLGARYREVRLDGGHMWMLGRGDRLGLELNAAL